MEVPCGPSNSDSFSRWRSERSQVPTSRASGDRFSAECACQRDRAHDQDHADHDADAAFLREEWPLSVPDDGKGRQAESGADDRQRTPPAGHPRGERDGHRAAEEDDPGRRLEDQRELSLSPVMAPPRSDELACHALCFGSATPNGM